MAPLLLGLGALAATSAVASYAGTAEWVPISEPDDGIPSTVAEAADDETRDYY